MDYSIKNLLLCKEEGCNMLFTEEGRMCIHMKKHEMQSNLSLENKPTNTFVDNVDPTPTPTLLINNCEEIRLFHDLKHVNTNVETNQRAVESKQIDYHHQQQQQQQYHRHHHHQQQHHYQQQYHYHHHQEQQQQHQEQQQQQQHQEQQQQQQHQEQQHHQQQYHQQQQQQHHHHQQQQYHHHQQQQQYHHHQQQQHHHHQQHPHQQQQQHISTDDNGTYDKKCITENEMLMTTGEGGEGCSSNTSSNNPSQNSIEPVIGTSKCIRWSVIVPNIAFQQNQQQPQSALLKNNDTNPENRSI